MTKTAADSNARPSAETLEFYRRSDPMSDAGRRTAQLRALPDEIGALTVVIQGLLLHQHVGPSYGEPIAEDRQAAAHIRPLGAMLDQLLAGPPPLTAQPLTTPRPLSGRLIGNCRHFSLLLVAILRAKGTPARARCGFGAYFEPGKFVDHWVCEWWDQGQDRWVLTDAQLDAHQRGLFAIDFDPLETPRDRFLVAGEAWSRCRAGRAEPSAFGIMEMSGLWFIAGNIVRDLAALNSMPMLPWDIWGGMALPGETLDAERLTYFDRLAALTLYPDARFEEVRARYRDETELRVPTMVLNAVRNRMESLAL